MSYADVLKAAGFNGKPMFDVMPWYNDGKTHRVSRYQSADPDVIKKQLQLIKLAGGSGVRVSWEGPGAVYAHQATIEMCLQCNETGMLFALLIDTEVAGQPNWFTDPGFLAMINSDMYVPEKFLCDYSTGIDYTKVMLPAGTVVLNDQVGFGWANAYATLPPGAGALTNNALTLQQLQAINKLPTMKWPFISLGFCDAGFALPPGVKPAAFTGTRDYAHSVWDQTKAARAIDHEAGNFFLDTVAALASCPNAPYVGMVWNDHEEGAGIEHFLASFNGVRLGK